jgi:cytochrome c-type biogenesis protein
MTTWIAICTAFGLGLLTAISPCGLMSSIAAIAFLVRPEVKPLRTLTSVTLYALGQAVVYLGLGALILCILYPAGGGQGAAANMSRFLQKWVGTFLGPILILAGMMLLDMLDMVGWRNAGVPRLPGRLSRGGSLWALPLGMVMAASFCPMSASLFFGGLIALSSQSHPLLLPIMFAVGAVIPVTGLAIITAFAGRYFGRTFDCLKQVERWARVFTGTFFVLIGIYYVVSRIYGLSL